MNKLSKIAIVSSLSILTGIIAVRGVALAQEPESQPMEKTNSETQEAPKNNPSKPNPRLRSKNIDTESRPTEQKEDLPKSGESRTPKTEQRELNIAEKTANREQKIQERCEAVGMKILNHQNNFKSKSQGRITKYNQITTRLETVSTKLAEKGVDVAIYNSYLVELKAKITALNTANQEYIQLFGTKANTGEFCNNKAQLATEVETRKTKLQAIIAKDKEIRMYIKDTIIPYLKIIKPESTTNTAPTNTSEPVPTTNTTVSPVQ